MNDSELSLAVARIMWPSKVKGRKKEDSLIWNVFDHTTEESGFKMLCWLSRHYFNIMETDDNACFKANEVVDLIDSNDPHRAIAEAIVEAANEH